MAHQKVLDSQRVLEFWFPNDQFQEFWFSNVLDHEIKIKFQNLLSQAEKGELDGWINESQSCLALIILLDQFSRNIYRNEDFRKNDQKCLPLALNIIESEKDKDYPIYQRIFIYLPLRHQHKTHLLDLVMSKIKKLEQTELTLTESNILRRFKNATLKDYGKVNDTIQVSKERLDLFNTTNINYVIDDVCSKYPEINTGLQLIKLSTDQISDQPLYDTIKNFIQESFGQSAVLCISLSGGVDSMVLSLILYYLRLNNQIKDFVAVHVDYANRQESNDEASFVINWCQFLNITIYWRRIEHMKRADPTIDIDFYETETKNIRFGLYKHVMKLHGVQGVFLGHHGDDSDENVLMNILRGKDILNLKGMFPYQMIDGVMICRPMLSHPKSDIYNLAHNYQVPYLKDTTSENCYRGFIRKIIPMIRSHDVTACNNIKLAGDRSSEWRKVFDKLVLNNILKYVVDYRFGFTINYDNEWINMPKVFWSELFVNLFHSHHVKMCTTKNLNEFMIWFDRGCKKGFRFSNNLYCFVSSATMYFLNFSLINPIHLINNVQIEIMKPYEANGWKINMENAVDEDRAKPITFENILDGEYSYYLHQVPKNSTTFTFTYSKGKDRNLKRYFKNFDIHKYFPKLKTNIEEGSKRTIKIYFKFDL